MGRQSVIINLLVPSLILYLILFSIPNIDLVKAEPKTIVIPDDYSKIQEELSPNSNLLFALIYTQKSNLNV